MNSQQAVSAREILLIATVMVVAYLALPLRKLEIVIIPGVFFALAVSVRQCARDRNWKQLSLMIFCATFFSTLIVDSFFPEGQIKSVFHSLNLVASYLYLFLLSLDAWRHSQAEKPDRNLACCEELPSEQV